MAVLDGASQPDPSPRNGGWLADQLGRELMRRLDSAPDAELTGVLENAIRRVADEDQLQPGDSPSTTVALVRWDAEVVDVLVLCDSPVVALTRDGSIRQVRDDRLADATRGLERPAGPLTDDLDAWRRFVAEQAQSRNQPGGYWVAEAVPEAAREAKTARWPVDDLAVVLAMTDGVSIGVDRYGVPPDWPTAIKLATESPTHLIDTIHTAEANDANCHRWPRSKRHDDKALAVLWFDQSFTC